ADHVRQDGERGVPPGGEHGGDDDVWRGGGWRDAAGERDDGSAGEYGAQRRERDDDQWADVQRSGDAGGGGDTADVDGRREHHDGEHGERSVGADGEHGGDDDVWWGGGWRDGAD